jgi:hypothetical protein
MPKRPFSLAIERIRGALPTALTQLDDTLLRKMEATPLRLARGAEHHIEANEYIGAIAQMTEQSSVLERMGAMLLLSSFIEGRIRAMYRDRHAIMHGFDRPSAAGEAQAFDAATQTGMPMPRSALDKDPVYRQLCQLRYYEDIDDTTFKELKLFTEVRNAMVHDAMYRVAAFQIEVIHALLPLVSHLTNNRQNVRNRTKKERELHAGDPHRADFFASLPVGTRLTRDELFKSVAGSPSSAICAPMSFGRPLYVVAQGGHGTPRVKIKGEEWYTHNLWASFIDVNVRIPVFRKVNVTNGQGATVEYIGLGRLQAHGTLAPDVMCDVVVG